LDEQNADVERARRRTAIIDRPAGKSSSGSPSKKLAARHLESYIRARKHDAPLATRQWLPAIIAMQKD